MNRMQFKKIDKHIKHRNNYGTEKDFQNKKSFNKKHHYNLDNDVFNFSKNETISNSQQTDITNNIIETSTQTTVY